MSAKIRSVGRESAGTAEPVMFPGWTGQARAPAAPVFPVTFWAPELSLNVYASGEPGTSVSDQPPDPSRLLNRATCEFPCVVIFSPATPSSSI